MDKNKIIIGASVVVGAIVLYKLFGGKKGKGTPELSVARRKAYNEILGRAYDKTLESVNKTTSPYYSLTKPKKEDLANLLSRTSFTCMRIDLDKMSEDELTNYYVKFVTNTLPTDATTATNLASLKSKYPKAFSDNPCVPL